MTETVPTDLTNFSVPPYRGHIDQIDPADGVRGWALDLFAPQRALRLELMIGDIAVAHTAPDIPREDISRIVGETVSPGFAFDEAALARAARLAASPDDTIGVRIAGSLYVLGFAAPVRAADLVGPANPLTGGQDWQPANSLGQAHGAKIFIERILVVPGLGCLVEGWVLSPLHRVAGLKLRVGGAVMTAMPEATCWKPRPDLAGTMPGSDVLAPRAGFAALFAEETAPAHFADPLFKIEFLGGDAACFTVPPKTIRLLGHAAGIEDAAAFFPALREEFFFPRFAQAALRAQRAALKPPALLVAAQTPRAIVCVLPDGRDELFLLFETIAAACRTAPLPGLVLLAAAETNRADAPWLLRDLLASHAMPASLLVIEKSADAFPLLPSILRDTGGKRFVFVGEGLMLTGQGWQAARKYLAGRAAALALFGLEPDPRAPRPVPTARCFAWTTDRFTAWHAGATQFYDGIFEDNGLAAADAAHTLHENAARALRDLSAGPLVQAVNRALADVG